MNRHILIVSDANVLIDIEDGGLTNSMFSLPKIKFCVPDVLFEEELKSKHPHLLDLGLCSCSLEGTSVAEVYNLAQKHGKVSRLDLFALQLAREKSALLLTGDMSLTKVAAKYEVECHGTIWLVETMVKQRIIQVNVAINAYQQMRNKGSRLPWEEAKQRLKDLEINSL